MHGIFYRPTDLSLLKEFSKKISFKDIHNSIWTRPSRSSGSWFRVLLEINGILNVLLITAKLACRNLSERSSILGPLWPWSVHQKTVYTLLLTYNVMYVHYLRMFLYWSSIYKLDSSSVFLLKFCMLITILPNFLLDFLVNNFLIGVNLKSTKKYVW